jgi:hypothetical protein
MRLHAFLTGVKSMETIVPSHSAEIIAFPGSAPTALSAQERLSRALARLEAALAEQRAAVQQWREGMLDLQASVGELGYSMQGLDASLETLGARNAEAHAEARRLEAWANQAPAILDGP